MLIFRCDKYITAIIEIRKGNFIVKSIIRIIAAVLSLCVICSCCACSAPADSDNVSAVVSDSSAAEVSSSEVLDELWIGGQEMNIYCWNEEFIDLYYPNCYTPEDIAINWVINPWDADSGDYIDRLDEALARQEEAPWDERVDLFLLQAEDLDKYIESDCTLSMEEIGFYETDFMYQYTLDAGTNSKGELKAVPLYLCPGTLIYRRSIARDVLGTDDPEEVQSMLDTWDKFNQTAADAAAKGYYMTASFADTLRPYAAGNTEPWVDEQNNLRLEPGIKEWAEQAKAFIENGYTLEYDFWDLEKNEQMADSGKTMCFFGADWYYNYCMPPIRDSSLGDWAICQGPQPYEHGGVWLLAARGTDNKEFIKQIFRDFSTDDEISEELITWNKLFPNNSDVCSKIESINPEYGNSLLDGQNDCAVMHEVAQNLVWNGSSRYSETILEDLPGYLLPYFRGEMEYDEALDNFKAHFRELYPEINVL